MRPLLSPSSTTHGNPYHSRQFCPPRLLQKIVRLAYIMCTRFSDCMASPTAWTNNFEMSNAKLLLILLFGVWIRDNHPSLPVESQMGQSIRQICLGPVRFRPSFAFLCVYHGISCFWAVATLHSRGLCQAFWICRAVLQCIIEFPLRACHCFSK